MALEHNWEETKFWRGSIMIHGVRLRPSLRVRIPCDPRNPESSNSQAFLESRAIAQARLDELVEALKRSSDLAETKRIIREYSERWNPSLANKKSSTGRAYLRIKALLNVVDDYRGDWSIGYLAVMKGYIKTFVAYMSDQYPNIIFCSDIESTHAKKFLEYLKSSNKTNATSRKTLSAMRTYFKQLIDDYKIPSNPFNDIKLPKADTVNHEPFTPEQVKVIIEEARKDETIGALAIIGLTTGLRQGDAAMITWQSIDLVRGVINLDCRKTGEPAWIPIFKSLRNLLETLPRDSDYVLPKLATQYEDNQVKVSELFTKFLERVSKVLEKTPHHFQRKQKRKKGLRMASVYAFGSFRTTWVTTAILAGIPIETVMRVMGHQNSKMIEYYYFRASEEQRIEELKIAFAPLLGEISPKQKTDSSELNVLHKIDNSLKKMNDENWKEIRDLIMLVIEIRRESLQ